MAKGTLGLKVTMAAVSIAVVSNAASATPFAAPLAIKQAARTDIEMVWGRGFGWGHPYGGYPYYGRYYGYGYRSFSGYPGRYPHDRQLCCRF